MLLHLCVTLKDGQVPFKDFYAVGREHGNDLFFDLLDPNDGSLSPRALRYHHHPVLRDVSHLSVCRGDSTAQYRDAVSVR